VAKPPAKAQRVTDDLAARIVRGEYSVGTWLPAERELAQMYGVDRSTVRRATRQLAEQDLVTVVSGMGVRVHQVPSVQRDATDLTQQVGDWRGFHVSARKSGKEPFTRTEVSEVAATGELARWMGMPVGTTVLQRARVQGIVGEPPSQLATTWVLLEVVGEIPILRQVNTGPGGIYSRLQEIGISIRFEESVTCRLAHPPEQAALEVGDGQPLLVLWRRGYDLANRIVEVTKRIVVPERQELVYRYGPTN
jgi:GntR family transcriptional regulator